MAARGLIMGGSRARAPDGRIRIGTRTRVRSGLVRMRRAMHRVSTRIARRRPRRRGNCHRRASKGVMRTLVMLLLPGATTLAKPPAPAPPGPDAPPDSVCIKWVSWKMPPQDPSNLPGAPLSGACISHSHSRSHICVHVHPFAALLPRPPVTSNGLVCCPWIAWACRD